MKCLTIVIIAVLSIVAADEEWKPPSPEAVDELVKECFKEVSPQNMAINTFMEGIHQDVLCRVKKTGIFSEENGFSFDRLVALFAAHNYDAENARRGIMRCIETNKKTSTVAEWAYSTDMCLKKVQLMNKKAQKKD